MRKTHRNIALSAVLLLALTVALGGIFMVSAETDDDALTEPPTCRPRFREPMLEIDEQLREEMHETVQSMREEGTTREEVREYVQGFLEENGVEIERPELSEEEKAAREQLREEVQAYAQRRAEELGIELHEGGFKFGMLRGGFGRRRSPAHEG